MKWEDDGIVIYKKALQEKGFLVGLLTRHHGRYSGWVRGHALPQLGEHVHCTWSARTEDQLGTWKLEHVGQPTTLQQPDRLMAISSMCQLCFQALPERHAYTSIFDAALMLAETEDHWRAAYIMFELTFLKEMGFGLSLESCAVTGKTEGLAYVSPKTGCAVTQEVGEPYHAHLLPLPLFLTQAVWPPFTPSMYEEALELTGYFIAKHICHDRLPNLRQMLAA